MTTPSFVLAHDYLSQRGGAERVALELARILDPSEVVTSVYVPGQTFEGFASYTVSESGNYVLRALRSDPRRALPVLAGVWSNLPPVDADVLVCSSSGWAHALRAGPHTFKVVYCHNPARWLYQPDDYLMEHSRVVRGALRTLAPRLRRWDLEAARTADLYLANSTTVAERIRRVYGIDAEVLHPPVSFDPAGPQAPVAGVGDGYFVSVGRPRGYKGMEQLVDAFAQVPGQRLVLVGVEPIPEIPDNVVAVGRVSEDELRWLYAHARALVSVSREDFGLTPIEANLMGTPALLLQAGGFLDSTDPGVSGMFIPTASSAAIARAVRDFPRAWDAAGVRRHAKRFSPKAFETRLRATITRVRAARSP